MTGKISGPTGLSGRPKFLAAIDKDSGMSTDLNPHSRCTGSKDLQARSDSAIVFEENVPYQRKRSDCKSAIWH